MSFIDFKEELHPRGSKGSSKGGQFVSKGVSGAPKKTRASAAKTSSLSNENKKEIAKYREYKSSAEAIAAVSSGKLRDDIGTLDAEDLRAIGFYAGPNARPLNRALRGGEEFVNEYATVVKRLDNLMKKSSLSEDLMLLRYHDDQAARIFEDLKPGDKVRNPGFTSTSVTQEAAGQNAKSMKILAPAGSRAVVVASSFRKQDEYEVILDRNSVLEYLGEDAGSKVFKLHQTLQVPAAEAPSLVVEHLVQQKPTAEVVSDEPHHMTLTGKTIMAEAEEYAPRTKGRKVPVIYKELNKRANDFWKSMGIKSGRVEGPDPMTDEVLADVLAQEIRNGLGDDPSAADWYDKTMKEAMRIAELIHPEIKNDKNKRFAFLVSLAVTSQGEVVDSSARLTEIAYEHFSKTGKFPVNLSVAKPSINGNFKKLNKMIDKMGIDDTEAFMNREFRASDLTATMKTIDPKFKLSKTNVDTMVYGSSVLGPKIGEGFYQNLNGNFRPVTVDIWFMRTWGRITGTGIAKPNPELAAAQKEKLVKALKHFRKNVPKTSHGLLVAAREIKRLNDRAFSAGNKTSAEKTELDRAAERYVLSRDNGMAEEPGGGTKREWMVSVFRKAIDKLAAGDKTHAKIIIDPASAQATIWNPEKVMVERLGGTVRELETDYAKTLKAIARDNNIDF